MDVYSRGQNGTQSNKIFKSGSHSKNHVRAHVTSRACFKWRHITLLTTARVREVSIIIIITSLKTKLKRHLPEEFRDYSWVFGPAHNLR